MKPVFAALAGVAILMAGCGPDAEPEQSPDWGAYDAQVAAEAEAKAEAEAVTVAAGATGGDIGSLLNAERAKNGLPALAVSAQLTAAARVHAQDMTSNGFFSHVGSDNSKPSKRVGAQGYSFCFVAENIAQGYPTPARTMQGWMDSPGHRKNNLTKEATQYGAAKVGDNWVMVFGKPGCGFGRVATKQRS